MPYSKLLQPIHLCAIYFQIERAVDILLYSQKVRCVSKSYYINLKSLTNYLRRSVYKLKLKL